jgi:choline dehydrogenase-like flavoprotein
LFREDGDVSRRSLETGTCIIGGGPAGITLARELVRAGMDVVLLESGRLAADPFAQDLLAGQGTGPVIKGYPNYLSTSRTARVLGSATRWGGNCLPLAPIDFERRDWVDHSGWPLRAGDLGDFAARAAATVGIPPFGPADMTLPKGGDPETELLTACSYHIPFKIFLLRDHFLELSAYPGFRAELGMTAVGITAHDGQVQQVRALGADGAELRVEAPVFVLAGGAVENARMLLLAADGQKTEITVNTDVLGRYFQEHFHVLAAKARISRAGNWRDYLWAAPRPLEGHQLMRTLVLNDETQARERLLNASYEISAKTLNARDLASAISTDGPIECDIFVRAEQAPNPESRVRLGDKTDKLGRRRAGLTWQTLPQDWDSIVRSVSILTAEIQRSWRAETKILIDRQWPWPWAPTPPDQGTWSTWGYHHMGTTRMDDNQARGVVDANCRVHGMSNLFVAGSSVFPTGGFANPTFTIVTLSIRLADHIASGLGASGP